MDVEDVAAVLLQMSFREKILPLSLHMDYIQRPPSRGCKIIGELGKITMDLTGLKVIAEKPDEEMEIYDFSGLDRKELFINEIDHFFDCVASRKPPIITIRDGVNSLRIALAIKESMETGKVISLK